MVVCVFIFLYFKEEGYIQSLPTKLNFIYDATQLNLKDQSSTDFRAVSKDLENNLMSKLQNPSLIIISVAVVSLSLGSLISDVNVTLRSMIPNTNQTINLFAQALYSIMHNGSDFILNNQKATMSQVIINDNIDFNQTDSPCDLKRKLPPCLLAEECHQQGQETSCLLLNEKDHRNFIIGLTVGITAFLLICICVIVMICCFTAKIKRDKLKEQTMPLHAMEFSRKIGAKTNKNASTSDSSKKTSNNKHKRSQFTPDQGSLWLTVGNKKPYSTNKNRPVAPWENKHQTHNRYRDMDSDKAMQKRYYHEPYPDYM